MRLAMSSELVMIVAITAGIAADRCFVDPFLLHGEQARSCLTCRAAKINRHGIVVCLVKATVLFQIARDDINRDATNYCHFWHEYFARIGEHSEQAILPLEFAHMQSVTNPA
ncbi:hypothetical protein ACWM9A_14520 [Acetobacter pasteurianus]